MKPYPNGVPFRGINRAGGEFGDDWNGWTGQEFFAFPSEPELSLELAFYKSRGFNALRLPISWERLQHGLNGPLDTDYVNQLAACISQTTSAGWLTIVDLHNYNRYAEGVFDDGGHQLTSFQQRIFGDGVLGTVHLVDVWTKIARLFFGNKNLAFNIMNEPHDFPVASDTWFADIQTVIDAIRATGADQLILVPNSRGSDVDHWSSYAPNGGPLDSVAALAITDSANNYAFDMHAYQDQPSSPTSYKDSLTEVTAWARSNARRLFLSELGVADGAAMGAAALGELLSYLNENGDVWVGWTAWNLPPYNLTQAGNYTADTSKMAWYTPYLTPDFL